MEKIKGGKITFIGAVMVLTMCMTITAYAGWQKNGSAWKYDYNGSYLTGAWDIN